MSVFTTITKINNLMNTTTVTKVTVAVPLTITMMLVACQKPAQESVYGKISGNTMGTSYNISFELPADMSSDEAENIQLIQKSIDKELLSFNDELSTWQEDSTITKFNNSPIDTPVEIDKHFYKTLVDSKVVYEQSKGAFDPTVKPIIELWGFGKEMRVDRLQNPPTPEESAQVKRLIGFNSISYQQTTNGFVVNKSKENIQVDFSAIAKGYGVDVIANVLSSQYQIKNFMVEIGGEVATSGINSNGKGWQIAIDAPILHSGIADRQLIATIRQPKDDSKISTMHLATSGNYRNSIVFDGIRYSHTIDPSTGNPVKDGASSVTVADASVALADAWATAFTAMPYDKALAMAKNLDKAVMFIVLKEGVAVDKQAYNIDDWQIVETPRMKVLRASATK